MENLEKYVGPKVLAKRDHLFSNRFFYKIKQKTSPKFREES